jgi:putative transposase
MTVIDAKSEATKASPPRRLGPPRQYDLRAIIDAILYLLAMGCQWRFSPREFPPRSTVQGYFYGWRDDGTWQRGSTPVWWPAPGKRWGAGRPLRPASFIARACRPPKAAPRAVSMPANASRVASATSSPIPRGFLLALRVHEANVQDPHGAVPLLRSLRRACPELRHVFADRAYRGPQLLGALADCGPWTIEIVERPPGVKGFQLLPRRWVVERTFAWLGRSRRVAKDFEATIDSAAAWVLLANLRLLSRRLATG